MVRQGRQRRGRGVDNRTAIIVWLRRQQKRSAPDSGSLSPFSFTRDLSLRCHTLAQLNRCFFFVVVGFVRRLRFSSDCFQVTGLSRTLKLHGRRFCGTNVFLGGRNISPGVLMLSPGISRTVLYNTVSRVRNIVSK